MTNRRIKPKLPGGVSRLISRFNRGDSSPLVVQTGFPTSLADLVVKNFSRLKKPKSAKKRSAPLPRSFRCTREEEIPEVVCQPEPEESVSFKPSNAVVRSQRLFDGPIGAIKASEGDDVALVNNELSQRKKNHMFGVQATLLLLSALFVCCKELVLGIMAFAVALLLLESFSSRLLFFQKHREDDIIEQSDGKQLIPEIAQESDNPRTEKIKKNRCWKNHIASELHGREIEEEDHPVTVTASRGVKSAETEEENRDDDGDDNEDKKGKNKDKNDDGENKKDQNNTIRSSNYLVLLIVVILWGLIGGRMLALGLTLISSYLVKISGMRIHM